MRDRLRWGEGAFADIIAWGGGGWEGKNRVFSPFSPNYITPPPLPSPPLPPPPAGFGAGGDSWVGRSPPPALSRHLPSAPPYPTRSRDLPYVLGAFVRYLPPPFAGRFAPFRPFSPPLPPSLRIMRTGAPAPAGGGSRIGLRAWAWADGGESVGPSRPSPLNVCIRAWARIRAHYIKGLPFLFFIYFFSLPWVYTIYTWGYGGPLPPRAALGGRGMTSVGRHATRRKVMYIFILCI